MSLLKNLYFWILGLSFVFSFSGTAWGNGGDNLCLKILSEYKTAADALKDACVIKGKAYQDLTDKMVSSVLSGEKGSSKLDFSSTCESAYKETGTHRTKVAQVCGEKKTELSEITSGVQKDIQNARNSCPPGEKGISCRVSCDSVLGENGRLSRYYLSSKTVLEQATTKYLGGAIGSFDQSAYCSGIHARLQDTKGMFTASSVTNSALSKAGHTRKSFANLSPEKQKNILDKLNKEKKGFFDDPLKVGLAGAAAGMLVSGMMGGDDKENKKATVNNLCNLNVQSQEGPDDACMDSMVSKCSANMGGRYCFQFSQYYCGAGGNVSTPGTGSEFCNNVSVLKKCTDTVNAADPDCIAGVSDQKLQASCPDYLESKKCVDFYAKNPSLHPDKIEEEAASSNYAVVSNTVSSSTTIGGNVSTQSIRKTPVDMGNSVSKASYITVSETYQELCDEGEVEGCFKKSH